MTTLPSINNYTPIIPKQNINITNQQFKYTPQGVDAIQKTAEATNPNIKPAKMLLSLMKGGISGKEADAKLFESATNEDWIRMYNLSHQNAVTQIAFDGIKNSKNITVPKECLKNMEINEDFVKEYHSMQEKVLGDFVKLTNAAGYDTVQMKGIGFSMNYPDPQKRFGGDIDVFNIKQGTTPEESIKTSSFEVDKLAKKAKMEVHTDHGYKHSVIKHKGMPIENHRYLLNVESAPIAKKMNDYLLKHINPVEQILPNGTKIKVPSKEFNTVFISFHAMQHFVGGNVNFHHLADWAVHVQKHGLKIPEEAKGTKFEQFMYAFTNLANKHLGTNVKVPENKKLEDAIYKTIIDPDNIFTIKKPKSNNPMKIFMYKFRRIAESQQRYHDFFDSSITPSVPKAITKSIIAHIKNPKSIIGVFTKL